MSKEIQLSAADGHGSFMAYLATPAARPAAAIVVIQEIFGVNAGIRKMCDDYAAAGYIALAPDLFWRQEPGIQLTDRSDGEWQKAFQLYQGFNVDKGIEDIQTTIDSLRAMDGSSGKVGTVGFCLGGLLAYLSATRTTADASVGYYGVGIQDKLAEAHHIKKPLILHIPTLDKFVDADAQAKIQAGLRSSPHVSLYRYEGQDHAFARVGGDHYDAASAHLANERTLALFNSALR
jgi:carboxymethylenebutenolidase